jgi:hypothetical protein
MTKEEIDSLPVGREMDFEVAEALGFKLEVRELVWNRSEYPFSDHPETNQIAIPVVTNPMHGITVEHYSTDPSAWWELVSACQSIGLIKVVFGTETYAELQTNDMCSHGRKFIATEATPLIALCRLLLKYFHNYPDSTF